MNVQFRPKRRPLTAEEMHGLVRLGYLAAGQRLELINGEMFEIAPIGAVHADVTARLVRMLTRKLDDGYLVWPQNPLRLDNMTEVYPDVCILRDQGNGFATRAPGAADALLVIEVADTTLAFDEGRKLAFYAANDIAEVWIVDVKRKRVTINREPNRAKAQYVTQQHIQSGSISPEKIVGISISVDAIFA
jgi:Uma2 family endonuclease